MQICISGSFVEQSNKMTALFFSLLLEKKKENQFTSREDFFLLVTSFPVFVWVVFIFLVLLMQWIQLTDNNSPSIGYVSQIRPKDVFHKLNMKERTWN